MSQAHSCLHELLEVAVEEFPLGGLKSAGTMARMNSERFFVDIRLPFVEGRYSLSSVRTFKPHMHRGFSIGAVNAGQVHFQAGAHSELLTPGALALINPETLHSCNTVGHAERSFFMLHLDIRWCLEIQKSICNAKTFVPAASVRLDDKILYMQYIDVMKKLMDQKVHLVLKEQLLLDLLAGVFKKSALVQELPQNSDIYAGKVACLKELLASELKQELTLESMARQLAANPYTLLRRFKAKTGITPHAFRMNCRIEQARKYLQEGLEIAEVALQCGFFDQSHLHRYFKAMTTLTPKEYQVNFIQ